ncbi:thioesterase [Gammaproteobacteria bacterium 45_16_T64]|nr:thioesterase [Gammaproteobacteria bacterium 45_16_T64]
MDLLSLVRDCRDTLTCKALIDHIPYSAFIGMECEQFGEEYIFRLPKNENNLGNPTLPAIHGGVLGGFLENAAIIHLLLKLDTPRLPKTIDFSIDYLRAGHHKETYASCEITRQGRRAANVSMLAWQTKKSEPIAVARAHFLMEQIIE